MDNKRAVILAGGKGTRLKPYTISLPKPLVPVGDIPVMEIIIRQLKKHGFNHITLAVNHMSEIIKAYFGDGSKWEVMIDYSEEKMSIMTKLQDKIDSMELWDLDSKIDIAMDALQSLNNSNKTLPLVY